jgi:hypothetical protein
VRGAVAGGGPRVLADAARAVVASPAGEAGVVAGPMGQQLPRELLQFSGQFPARTVTVGPPGVAGRAAVDVDVAVGTAVAVVDPGPERLSMCQRRMGLPLDLPMGDMPWPMDLRGLEHPCEPSWFLS